MHKSIVGVTSSVSAEFHQTPPWRGSGLLGCYGGNLLIYVVLQSWYLDVIILSSSSIMKYIAIVTEHQAPPLPMMPSVCSVMQQTCCSLLVFELTHCNILRQPTVVGFSDEIMSCLCLFYTRWKISCGLAGVSIMERGCWSCSRVTALSHAPCWSMPSPSVASHLLSC